MITDMTGYHAAGAVAVGECGCADYRPHHFNFSVRQAFPGDPSVAYVSVGGLTIDLNGTSRTFNLDISAFTRITPRALGLKTFEVPILEDGDPVGAVTFEPTHGVGDQDPNNTANITVEYKCNVYKATGKYWDSATIYGVHCAGDFD